MHYFIGRKESENRLILFEEEGHHCIRVTRHQSGDQVLVTDLFGIIWKGKILNPNPVETEIEIIEVFKRENTNQSKIKIGISLTQNSDRFEWFLEKAVEVGIDEIHPLVCKRTENRKEKMERWQKIIRASTKQTLRAMEPKIFPLNFFSNFIKTKFDHQRFICHCENENENFLGNLYLRHEDALILIGPEGDFDHDEINLCKQFSFQPAHLGELRLRTETAGIYSGILLKSLQLLQ